MPGRLLASFALLAVLAARPAAAASPTSRPPAHLPRYDLDLTLDTPSTRPSSARRVTWTNRHQPAGRTLVFNFYPHYRVPRRRLPAARQDAGTAAAAAVARDRPRRPARRHRRGDSSLGEQPADSRSRIEYDDDNPTALRDRTARSRSRRASRSTVELDVRRSSCRTSRAGGATGRASRTSRTRCRSLAYYDDAGWQPMPFVPWHQPFFNEAGVFTRAITLPDDEMLACSGRGRSPRPTCGDGWKKVDDRAVRRPRLRGPVQRRATRSSAATTQLPDGRDGRAPVPRVPRARVLRQRDPADRRRGDPGLLAVVRPVPVRRSSPSPSRTSAGTATSAPAWS